MMSIKEQKNIAIVVGTGRSGTSIVANMLHVLGVNMGETFVPHNHNNPTGTYEDTDFASINRMYLSDKISKEKWVKKVTEYIRIRVEKHKKWGWKIPSTSNLIKEYLEILPDAKYIWCKRKKEEFIASCQKAYGWDRDKAIKLYEARMDKLNNNLNDNNNVLILNYDDIRNNTHKVVDKIIDFINIEVDDKKINKAVNMVLSKEEEDKARRSMIKNETRGSKVLLGLPNGSGYFPFETVEALLKLHKPPVVMLQIIARLRVDKARNEIFKTALESGSDYVFFVDDDNPPPADALMKMLKNDKDIVTTPILQRNGDYKICLFDKYIKDVDGHQIVLYENLKELSPQVGGLQRVDATGLGCCLIKRKVIEVLMNKYEGHPFDFIIEEYGDNERRLGEDITFSERATKEGFEIWANTDIRPIHLGDKKHVQITDNLIK